MKIALFSILSAAASLSVASAASPDTINGDIPAMSLNPSSGLVAGQATREQVVARRMARDRGIGRRDAAASPRPGLCGTASGASFMVRATGTVHRGRPPIFTTGYLYTDPTVILRAGLPHILLADNQEDAAIFTLDESNGCALTDAVNIDMPVRASPRSTGGGGSVVVEGTQESVDATGANFQPFKCKVDTEGMLACSFAPDVDTRVITPMVYNYPTDAGDAANWMGACFQDSFCASPFTYVNLQIIPV